MWRDEAVWASGASRTPDTTSEFYGWEAPQLLTGTFPLDWQTTNRDGTFMPDLIRLDNGTLGAFYGQNTSTNQLLFSTYDPATGVWTDSTEQPDNIVHNVDIGSLVQLPKASGDANGRVLCFYGASSGDQIDVMYSDDLMVTWVVMGRRILSTEVGDADMNQMKARYGNGQILMLIAWDNATSGDQTHNQYASSDNGASFDLVEADFETAASPDEGSDHPAIVALSGGGFLVVTHENGSQYNERKIGSAYVKLSTVASSVAAGGQTALTPGATMWRSEDGAIYQALHQTANPAVSIRRSKDEGESWEFVGYIADFNDGWGTDTYLHTFAAESVAGRTFLLSRHVGPSSNYAGQSITAIELGGFSRMTAPFHVDSKMFRDGAQSAWSSDDGASPVVPTQLQGNMWIPLDEPGQIDGGSMWTVTGAGTDALASTGEMSIDTTAATRYYTRTYVTESTQGTPTRDPVMMFAEFAVEIDSGDGDSTTEQISGRMRLTDGKSTSTTHTATFNYEITIQFSSAGYRIYDANAGPAQVGSATTADFEARRHVRVALDAGGNVYSWHSVDGHYRKWVEGANGNSLTAGTLGNIDSLIEWGHRANTTSTSRWSLVGWNFWCQRLAPESLKSAAGGFTNPTDLHPQTFPTVPATISGGVQIQAVDGPAVVGDTWDIVARYDHPVSFAFHDKDPSPQRLWRTTGDNSAVDLIIKQDSSSSRSQFLSGSVGIFVRGANFPDFTLARHDGTSTWTTIATATGKLDGLSWKRNGRYVLVDAGNAGTTGQFIRWGDAVGGTFEFSSTVHRKIVAHTSGTWTDETGAVPVFELEGVDDSEGNSGTAGEVWFPDFGVVVHDYASTEQIFRIQIQAAHTTADDYRGKFIVGSVHPFGFPHDRGWSIAEEHDVDLITRPGGLRHGVKRGPPRRSLNISWTDATIDETQTLSTLTSSNIPDYVAANSNASATRYSTASDVMGIVRQQTGPKDPIVFLRQIKQGVSSEQYIGGLLWIHGRIETTDPQYDNVVGREAVNPFVKINTIVIVEEQ